MKCIGVLYVTVLVTFASLQIGAMDTEWTGIRHIPATISMDPVTIQRIERYMDQLAEYAVTLPPRYNPIKNSLLRLQSNVKNLAKMKSRSLNSLYSRICEEFDEFFKPSSPDYFVHSVDVGPAFKTKRKAAESKVRRAYGAIQSLWLTKLMEDDEAARLAAL